MPQPIEGYLEQALLEFERHLQSWSIKESPFMRAEKVVGAKLFVGFLLGRPLPNPFAERGGAQSP